MNEREAIHAMLNTEHPRFVQHLTFDERDAIVREILSAHEQTDQRLRDDLIVAEAKLAEYQKDEHARTAREQTPTEAGT